MNEHIVTHAGANYPFPVAIGKVVIPADEVFTLPAAVIAILYFDSSSGRLRLETQTFHSIKDQIKKWVDWKNGGLNAAGLKTFDSDGEVLAAAERHKSSKRFQVPPASPPPRYTIEEALLDAANESGLFPSEEAATADEIPADSAEYGKPKPPIPQAGDDSMAPPADNATESASAPEGESSVDFAIEAEDSDKESYLAGWYQHQPISWISPHELTPHPLNGHIAGDEIDDDFLESIRLFGVQQPIVATRSKEILGGKRRCLSAIKAGRPQVPVIFTDAPPELLPFLIVHLNNQRPLSNTAKICAYLALKENAAVAARLRQLAGKHLPEIIPGGQDGHGNARDLAAKGSGFSGRTMDDAGKTYLEAVRRQNLAITPDEAAAVLAKIEVSPSGAYKLARSYDWWPTESKKNRNGHENRSVGVCSPATDVVEEKIMAAIGSIAGSGQPYFAFDVLAESLGQDVSKTALKRWIDEQKEQNSIRSATGSGNYAFVTRSELQAQKEHLEEQIRHLEEQLDSTKARIKQLKGREWLPA